MNYDDFQSDGERTPDHHQHHLVDDVPDDDAWHEPDRLSTPVHDTDPLGTKSKPRKRLIKKSHAVNEDPTPNFLGDEDEDEGFVREGSVGKRKKLGGSGKKEKRHKGEKKFGMKSGLTPGSSRRAARDQRDGEVKEMWDTIAGGDSEVLVIIILCSYWSLTISLVHMYAHFVF